MFMFFFFLMIRRPPRSTLSSSSAASDVYKRQVVSTQSTGDNINNDDDKAKNGNGEGSEEEEVPNPYAHYDDEEDDEKKNKKRGSDDDEDGDEEGGEENEEDDENKVDGDGEEKKDGKKDATPVIMPPGTGKPIAGARRVEMEVQEHEKQQYTFDSPDPQFFLGAAIVIGLVCLLTFFYRFIVDYGKVEDQLIPIVVFVGAFVVWIIPFVYYLFSSQHYAVWGRLELSLIHISEPTRLLSISYAVFCLKKKKNKH
eukprot:TRINITY_DN52096_c0_g1_i1.p1 TRINITY_DN52096_c0_g1~~TRINITY_DN52096_c0_g1_i1.p1  ORF type:complete len:255 (+),score=109.34 TRINITY_DN52096_c0_g1_i1:119-883(+)